MAFQQPFIDSSGNVCPAAYWIPVQVNLGYADRVVQIVWYGYRTAEDYEARRAPLPGARKSYVVEGEEFLALYRQHIAPGGPNLQEMVFAYALAKKDTPDPRNPGELVSFFEGATVVP